MPENNQNDLVITRTFDAPLEKVWKAFTEPEQMVKWWGPNNITAPSLKIDFRVGGKFLYYMRFAETQDIWGVGTYKEIIPMEKIVCTDSFADENGNVISGEKYGMKDVPLEATVTFTFENVDGKTKFTLKHEGIPAGEITDQTKAGWNESLDKLTKSLQ